MNKKNIFPLAIGTYGLGANRSESWEDDGGIPIYKFANQIE